MHLQHGRTCDFVYQCIMQTKSESKKLPQRCFFSQGRVIRFELLIL